MAAKLSPECSRFLPRDIAHPHYRVEARPLYVALPSTVPVGFRVSREGEKIECVRIIRLQMNCGLQFRASVFVLAGLEKESAQIVVGGSKVWIQPRGLRKFLEPAGTVELIDQCDAQVQMTWADPGRASQLSGNS